MSTREVPENGPNHPVSCDDAIEVGTKVHAASVCFDRLNYDTRYMKLLAICTEEMIDQAIDLAIEHADRQSFFRRRK